MTTAFDNRSHHSGLILNNNNNTTTSNSTSSVAAQSNRSRETLHSQQVEHPRRSMSPTLQYPSNSWGHRRVHSGEMFWWGGALRFSYYIFMPNSSPTLYAIVDATSAPFRTIEKSNRNNSRRRCRQRPLTFTLLVSIYVHQFDQLVLPVARDFRFFL